MKRLTRGAVAALSLACVAMGGVTLLAAPFLVLVGVTGWPAGGNAGLEVVFC
jgi:hypothetical protein